MVRQFQGVARQKALWGCSLLSLAAAGFLLISASRLVAQAPPAPHAPPPRFMVVLDPAHGGEDSGALLKSGQAEKTLALAFAYRLRSMLGARGMQVVFTRENDGTVGPDQRAETANRAQAQACLSVHFTETGTGVHLFASDLSQSSSGQRFVPWKTAQSTWINRSLALTGRVNSTLQQAGVNVTLARIALPGLDSMACPALAIEIAPEQSGQNAALDDPKYQARLAGALSAALLAWRSEQHP